MEKIKKFLILVLGILFSTNVYSDTWICKNERFGKFKWEYDKNYIYEVFPNDEPRKYKITKDYSEHRASIFGESKGGAIFDYDVYIDFKDREIKVRKLDRTYGVSGEYYNTDCEIFK